MEAKHREIKDVKLPLRSSSDLRQKSPVILNHAVNKTFSSRRLSVNRGEISAILSGSAGAATSCRTSKGAVVFSGSDGRGDDGSSCQQLGGGGGGGGGGGSGGVRASVPFTWESQPGTPKVNHNHDHRDHHILPPLTPPPSYFYCTPARNSLVRKLPKSNSTSLLHSIFPRLRLGPGPRKPRSPPSSSSSSSSSYSSSRSSGSSPSHHWPPSSSARSVPASPVTPLNSCTINARVKASNLSRLSLDSRVNVLEHSDDIADDCESDVPALCFRLGRGANNSGSQGCYLAFVKLLQGKFI